MCVKKCLLGALAFALTLPATALAQSHCDGFEDGTLHPWWNSINQEDADYSFVTAPQAVHGGSQSLRFDTYYPVPSGLSVGHSFDAPTYGRASVWVYDTGAGVQSSNTFYFLVTGDSAEEGFAYWGVWDYDFARVEDYYWTYHKYNGDGSPQRLYIAPRTTGWHKWEIECSPDSVTFSLDGNVVQTLGRGMKFSRLILTMGASQIRAPFHVYWDDFEFVQILPNQDPVAEAGPNQTVQCTGGLSEVALDGSASYDPDGDPIEYEWSAPDGVVLDDPFSRTPTGLFPVGPTLVTLTVTDGKGGVATDDVLITVQDTQPPVVVCTTDLVALWPPDHRMVNVLIVVQASDACTSPEDLLVMCTVSSSEPDDGAGDGSFTGDVDGLDGHTAPVPVELTYDPITGCFFGSVALRAERDGSEVGRWYSIVTEVADAAGLQATASCVVVVPHDRRKK